MPAGRHELPRSARASAARRVRQAMRAATLDRVGSRRRSRRPPHPGVEDAVAAGRRARLKKITAALENMNSACSIGQVGFWIASPVARPRPGYEKTVSVEIAPPMMKPKLIAISDTDGSSAFGTAWRRITSMSRRPLARAGDEVVLAERVEHRRAHHQRVRAEVAEGERRHRQDQMLEPVDRSASSPYTRPQRPRSRRREPAGRPAKNGAAASEEELGRRVQHHGRRRWTPCRRAAPPPSGSGADPQPDRDREHGRGADEQQRRPQPIEDLVGHGRRRVEGAAEVELQRVLDVLDELLPLGPIRPNCSISASLLLRASACCVRGTWPGSRDRRRGTGRS